MLRVVSRLLSENVREIDTVARYGGEEFVGFFPETSAGEAPGYLRTNLASDQGLPVAERSPQTSGHCEYGAYR